MKRVVKGADELPVPVYVSREDVDHAVTALVVHAAGDAPGGVPVCRHDGAPHPCRLHRWGRRVLAGRGLDEPEIARLVAGREAGEGRR